MPTQINKINSTLLELLHEHFTDLAGPVKEIPAGEGALKEAKIARYYLSQLFTVFRNFPNSVPICAKRVLELSVGAKAYK
jgi:hypothetical protein